MSGFLNVLWNNKKWHRLILFTAAFMLYANTLRNGFVLDDNIVLCKNEFVKKGFAGIPDILTHDSFKGFFLNDQSGVTVTGGRYRPLSQVLFAAKYPFLGLQPMYYHLINIFLFAILCVLMYGLVSKLLSQRYPEHAAGLALLSTLFFAFHPIHTEAVSNIKGLDEILSLLFSVMSFSAVLRYIDQTKAIQLLWAFLFFALAFFSKESAAAFLVLIPLGIWMFRNMDWKKMVMVLLPLLLASVVYFAARTAAIGFTVFGEATRDVLTNPFLKIRGTSVTDASLTERLGMIFYCLGKYLQLMIFPHPLTHDYFPQHVRLQGLNTPIPFISLLLILGLLLTAWLLRKRNALVAYALILLIIPLILISNLVVPMGVPMGERFAFTASWGFCLLAAYGLYKLNIHRPALASAVLIVSLGLFAAKLISRNTDWKDEYSLFSTDVRTSVNSVKAHDELAYHLIDKIKNSKDTATTRMLVSEALPHLEKAVQLYPRHANALFLIGNLNYLRKDYEKAIATYEKYLELVPTNSDVIRNLQVSYREYGRDLAVRNTDLDKSVDMLIKSLKIKPSDPRLLESLGIAYSARGEFDLSIDYFDKAIKADPKNGMVRVNMANTYYKKGDKARATALMSEAYKIDPTIGPKLMTMQKPY